MNWHKCDVCGCYLDPGEGFLCDECREEIHRRSKEKERINRILFFEIDQLKMRLEDMV